MKNMKKTIILTAVMVVMLLAAVPGRSGERLCPFGVPVSAAETMTMGVTAGWNDLVGDLQFEMELGPRLGFVDYKDYSQQLPLVEDGYSMIMMEITIPIDDYSNRDSQIFVLLPYDTPNTLAGFKSCQSRMALRPSSATITTYSDMIVYKTETYPLIEMDIPSGVYKLAVVYFQSSGTGDPLFDGSGKGLKCTKLLFSNLPLRISNSSDGGYVSDEHYGFVRVYDYVDIDAEAYYGEHLASRDEADIYVYDAKTDFCYGKVPCKAPLGGEVRLEVVPKGEWKGVVYDYKLSEWDEGKVYTVKGSSTYQINYYRIVADGWISGKVQVGFKRSDGTTELLSFGGIRVAVTQNINGKTVCSMGKTDARGEYVIDYCPRIPATVLIEDERFETFSQDVPASESRSRVSVDAMLEIKAPSQSQFTGSMITVPVSSPTVDKINATAVLFYATGDLASRESALISMSESSIILEVLPGEYTLAVFDDTYGASFYIRSLDDLGTVLTEEEYVKVELYGEDRLESGYRYTLDPVTVPVSTREHPSSISVGSYIEVPAEFTSTEELITVRGHIAHASELNLSRILVDMPNGGSAKLTRNYYLATGSVVENSLVVNGQLTSMTVTHAGTSGTTDTVSVGNYGGENYDGPIDFSFKIRPSSLTDICIRVVVEVRTGVGLESVELCNTVIKGLPVSISADAKTATGQVFVSGTSAPESQVTVYDGTSAIGAAVSDVFGHWECSVKLDVNGGKSVHCLKAVCNKAQSDVVSVTYAPDEPVLRRTNMLDSKGNVMPSTYIWVNGISLGFSAVYENAENVDDVTIYVQCSDGTMLALPTKKELQDTAGSAATTLFKTETASFNGQVPVAAWAVVNDADDRTAFEKESAGRVGTASMSDYCGLREAEVKARDWSSASFVSGSSLIDGSFEDYTGYGYISYTTETAELEALGKQGAYHTQILDDDGYMIYDCYYLKKDGVSIWGYTDYYDRSNYGASYIVAGSSITQGGLAQQIKDVYETLDKSDSDYRFVADAYNRRLEALDAVTFKKETDLSYRHGIDPGEYGKSMQGTMTGVLFDSLLDFAAETYPEWSIGSKYSLDVSAGVPLGVGDVMCAVSVGKSVNEYSEIRKQVSEYREQIYGLKQTALELYMDGKIDERTYNRINRGLDNALSDFDKAEDIYYDSSQALVESSIVCKTGDFAGPVGKCVGAAGGFLTDLVTGDMKVNGQVVFAGAQEEFMDAKLAIVRAAADKNSGNGSSSQNGGSGQGQAFSITAGSYFGSLVKDQGECTKYTPIIDPSGYVYEAVASNRIEGATLFLYGEGLQKFDAEHYGQTNPVTSDGEGRYAWDVPEGNWFVRAYLAGYEIGTSQGDPAATVTIDGVNYLPVMPPQLDVNIPLTAIDAATPSVFYEAGSWYLEFDKYVQIDTLTPDNISFTTSEDTLTAVITPLNAELSPAHTPICGGLMLATRFKLEFSDSLAQDAPLSIIIGGKVMTYNGKSATYVLTLNGAQYEVEYTGADISLGNRTEENRTVVPMTNPQGFEDEDDDGYDDDFDEDFDEEASGFPGWAIVLIVVGVVAAGGGLYFFKKRSAS